MEKPPPYYAYMIRLWPTKRGGVTDYRVSVESVASGERFELPHLESLVPFLRAEGGEEGIGTESGGTAAADWSAPVDDDAHRR